MIILCRFLKQYTLKFFVNKSFHLKRTSSLRSPVLFDELAVKKYLQRLEEEHGLFQNKDTYTNRYIYLNNIIKVVNEKRQVESDIENLKTLNSETDHGLKKLVDEENLKYGAKIEKLNAELYELLLPPEEEGYRDVVLEVTAGIGGKEAMLFASELYNMYMGLANFKQWSFESAGIDVSDLGGIRHASVFVSGKSVFGSLMQESGVHRVQRVPSTEKSGRLHTSTVTVAVLPQPTDIEIVINNNDISIETKRSSGAGGQHVNTTDSCVRITHLPTGLVVEAQSERSQLQNKKIALKRLRMKLFQKEHEESTKKVTASRKEQVGSSSRSEKVRTYNYNQDRVTDHRLGENVFNLQSFLAGGEELDAMISKLRRKRQEQELLQILSSMG